MWSYIITYVSLWLIFWTLLSLFVGARLWVCQHVIIKE